MCFSNNFCNTSKGLVPAAGSIISILSFVLIHFKIKSYCSCFIGGATIKACSNNTVLNSCT